MRGYRYWGMLSLLGAGLAMTLAGCGGGGSSSSSSASYDSSYESTAAVTTFAGSGSSGSTNNTTGTSATFNAPTGLALNAGGTYLYVADTGNSLIRKVKIATDPDDVVVSTYYPKDGSSALSSPEGLVFNSTTLYICDTKNAAIKYWDGSSLTTFCSGLNYPSGIILSGSYFYVADRKNNVVKQIDSTGTTITTYGSGTAGNNGSEYNAASETSAGTAQFNNPYGVATDGTYLYVSDCTNSTIRRINITAGTVTILAGLPGTTGTNDSTDGTGETATFNNPTGITYYDSDQCLYVADTGNHAIRKVNASTGETTTIAGYKGSADFKDGTGNTTKFSSPTGIISDGTGTLYVGDKGNNRIRKIVLSK